MKKLFGLAPVIAAALFAAATPAQAAVQIITAPYTPTEKYGGIKVNAIGFQQGGTAGRFKMTVQDLATLQEKSFFSFCVDVAVGVQGFVAYNDVAAALMFADPTKRAHLAALLANGNPLIDGAATDAEAQEIAAALALAVWEVVYDHYDSFYDVTAGNFSVYGDFDPLAARANGYLGNVLAGDWTGDANRLRGLQAVVAGSTQNQIYMGGAVPEPDVWAMLILGFFAIGSALRRRAQQPGMVTAAA
jgi:hypothetical protein